MQRRLTRLWAQGVHAPPCVKPVLVHQGFESHRQRKVSPWVRGEAEREREQERDVTKGEGRRPASRRLVPHS